MNKLSTLALASAVAAFAALAAAPAFAQSTGNFTATANDFACTINDQTGTLSTGTLPLNFHELNIKVSNGSGVALVITPSLVTGLFTDNKITSSFITSTQDVGVLVDVKITPPPGVSASGIQLAPNTTSGNASCTSAGAAMSCVIYDQRFIQVSSQILSALASLTGLQAFELVESTLSAHAFNFYAQLPTNGTYKVDVGATLFTGAHNVSGSVAACAGPGTVTVTQVKNFSFDSGLSF